MIPDIVLDMRYATAHNFIGRPIPGYRAAKCLLTQPAAAALALVQSGLRRSGLGLKVYDTPTRNVAERSAARPALRFSAHRAREHPSAPARAIRCAIAGVASGLKSTPTAQAKSCITLVGASSLSRAASRQRTLFSSARVARHTAISTSPSAESAAGGGGRNTV
jgi:hypothetical protein